MPAPMVNAAPAASAALPKPQGLSPAQNNPLGTGAQGYNAALGSLQNSLKSLQGTDTAQLAAAQQQLQQNQGKVQQGLINSGLGNTTVAQTMQQAPLQTYNQQVQGIQNALGQQQSGVYGQMAGTQSQGGGNLAQLAMQMQALQAQQQQQDQKNVPQVRTTGMPLPGVG